MPPTNQSPTNQSQTNPVHSDAAPVDPAGAAAGETPQVLRLTRRLAAPREAVFRAFTEPEAMVQWWGPEGMDVPEIRMDVRVGGGWRTCMRSPAGDLHCVAGVYREISPPERLVMTWAWEGDDGPGRETLVTLEFHDRDGETELVLIHENLASVEAAEKHQMGWTSSFNCLAQYLAENGEQA